MKTKVLFGAALMVVVLVGACVPVTPVIPQTGTDTNQQTPGAGGTLEPNVTQSPNPRPNDPTGGSPMDINTEIANRVSRFLANRLNVPVEDVTVLSTTETTFSDSCLGLGQLNESCAAVQTQGWRVVAQVGGSEYAVRANVDGTEIRIEDPVSNETGGSSGGNAGGSTGGNTTGEPGSVVSLDQVITLASQFLSQTLNVPLNQVSLGSVTAEQWPDACLGVQQSGTSCAQVVTPGYRIVLNVGSQRYELRTNANGSNIQLVPGAQ